MTISHGFLNFLRGLGVAAAMGVLIFLANAANLHGIVPDTIAAFIASLALSIEGYITSQTGSVLASGLKVG